MKLDKDLWGAGGSGGKEPTRTPDSIRSQDHVEIVLAVGEGEMKGLVQGNDTDLSNFFVGDTPAQNGSTGEYNFNNFAVATYTGHPEDDPIELKLGGSAQSVGVNVRLSQNTPVTRQTPSTARGAFDRLEFRIYFNQLVDNRDDGTFKVEARFRIEYKPNSSNTWLRYNNLPEIELFDKTVSGAVRDFVIDIPLATEDYDLRVTKLSADNNGAEGEVVELTWESFQMVKRGALNHPNIAKIHIFAQASNQFSSVPEFASIWDGLIVDIPTNYNPVTRTYDETVPWNGLFKKGFTNNPAWILRFLAMDTRLGLARYYLNATTNRYQFYEAAKWCDEMVDDGRGGLQPRFTFNGEISEPLDGLELLRYIAGSFNAVIYDEGNGVINLKIDKPQAPVLIFTPENVDNEGFNYTFTDISTRYNEIKVSFVNPELDWAQDWRFQTIDNTAEIAKNGRIPLDFDAVGCTNAAEAIRRANYRYITATTEKTTVSFRTTRVGMNAGLFDTVYIADPEADWSSGGRVKSTQGSIIHLRDPIYFPDANPRNMKVQTFDGLVNMTIVPTVVGAAYSLNIVAGVFPTNVPDNTVFTIEDQSILGLAKPFKILSIAEVEGSPDYYEITALEVNVNKYPDSDSGILSPPVKYAYTQPGEPILPQTINLSTPPPIINSDGTLTYRIYVSWERPLEANTERYEIEYQEQGSGTWETVISFDDDAYCTPVRDGAKYRVRLWAVSPLGKRSQRAIEVSEYTVVGKTGTLLNVSGLNVVYTNIGWDVIYNEPGALLPDFDYTGIKIGNVGDTWNGLAIDFKNPRSPLHLPWQLSGTHRIFAKYFDTSGNESVDAVFYDLVIRNPATPILEINRSFGATEIRFQDCTTDQPLASMEIRVGVPGGSYETATTKASAGAGARSHTIVPSATETLRVFVRAIDVAGNGSNVAFEDIPPGADSVAELLDIISQDIFQSDQFLQQFDANVAERVLEETNARIAMGEAIQTNLDQLAQETGNLSSQVTDLSAAFSNDQQAGALRVELLRSQLSADTINSDPLIRTLDDWGSLVSPTTIEPITGLSLGAPKAGYPSEHVLRAVTAGGTKRLFNPPAVRLDPTHKYRISAKMLSAPNKQSGRFYLCAVLFREDGSVINGASSVWWLTIGGSFTAGQINTISSDFGAGSSNVFPDEAKFIGIGVLLTWNDGSIPVDADGWMEAWDIRLQDITLEKNLTSQISSVSQALTTAEQSLSQRIDTVESTAGGDTTFTAVSTGNAYSGATGDAGLFDKSGARIPGAYTRSYNVWKFDANNVPSFVGQYDVFGVGEIGGKSAASMAADLNALPDGTPVVVITYDEPNYYRLSAGLPEAMYRCGASAAVFASDSFAYRAAYVLVGVAGIGAGRGIEGYKASVFGPHGPTDAKVSVTFQIVNGKVIGLTSAAVQQEIQTRSSQIGHLSAQYALRISLMSNGVAAIGGMSIAGSSSATAGPVIDMAFRANKFAFLPPEGAGDGPAYPMVYYSTPTVVNGVLVQPGLYLKSAFVEMITADKVDTKGLAIRDTAGNVILASGTSLPQDYMASFGGNLVYNSDFRNGSSGWYYSGSYGIDQNGGSGVDLSDAWCINPAGAPGNGVFWTRQGGSGAQTDFYYEFTTDFIPVEANRKYIVSAYSGAHRCAVNVFLYIYDVAGNLIGYSDGAGAQSGHTSANYAEMAGGRNIGEYKRIYGIAALGSNAAKVKVCLRKYNTFPGQADSYMFIGRVMLERVPGLATTPGPWTGTMGDPTAVRQTNPITAGNVSTYIENAAIGSAQVGVLTAGNLTVSALSGTINAGTGRVVVETNRISVYDGNNNLRVRMGLL